MKTDVPFNGHRVFWSFKYEPENYLKESELSGDEIRKGGYISIFRNDVCILKDFCREADRAASRIYSLLISCMDVNWDLVKKGHRLYWWSTPAIIDTVLDNGDMILKTENGENFPLWGYEQEEIKEGGSANDDWTNTMKCHATTDGIYWYRK